MGPTPVISIVIAWEAAVSWNGRDEVGLRLESRSSGQIDSFLIQIDGSTADAAPQEIESISTIVPLRRVGLLAIAGRVLGVILILICCGRCCGALVHWRRAPPMGGSRLLGTPFRRASPAPVRLHSFL